MRQTIYRIWRKWFRFQRLIWAIALSVFLLILFRVTAFQPAVAQTTDPAIVGAWSAPLKWPLVPIHVSVGPNGKVLAWQRPKLAPSGPQSILWDPANNQFSSVPSVVTDIFCAGHAFAPSGRLLVAGGHEGNVADVGSKDTNVYDFGTNKWFSYLNRMVKGRWYPTVTYLPNGEAVVVAGADTSASDNVRVPEVWTSGAKYRSLTGAPLELPLYPWGYVAPSGRVFYAGPSQTTRVLDTSSSGRWSTVSNSNLGNRYYGSSVMYDDGKVLIAGGGLQKYSGLPTNSAEVIDVGVSNQWIPVSPMAYRRRHHNATLLPDGKVLVTGGTSAAGFNTAINQDGDGRVLAAEMWDPQTTQWSTMARMQVGRLYHSVAALLPDGRVLVGGGGLPLAFGEPSDGSSANNQGHYDVEIYSPPYLFKGTRPTITSVTVNSTPTTSLSYGQEFIVNTPNASNIKRVTWIRLSSVTHSFNENQRISRPSFTTTTGGLRVTAPTNKNLTPPGHYMMFILNQNDVPSVARIVSIN